MDLLRRLWNHGDEAVREGISTLLVAEPPEALLARLDEDRRTASRDRRICDRLVGQALVRDEGLRASTSPIFYSRDTA